MIAPVSVSDYFVIFAGVIREQWRQKRLSTRRRVCTAHLLDNATRLLINKHNVNEARNDYQLKEAFSIYVAGRISNYDF